MEDLKKLHVDGTDYDTRLTRKYSERPDWRRPDHRQVRSIIPGQILAVNVRPGQKVKRGDGLLVLEAMKMENQIASPREGVIRNIAVVVGQNVPKNTLLIEFEE